MLKVGALVEIDSLARYKDGYILQIRKCIMPASSHMRHNAPKQIERADSARQQRLI
jgi:hypothetical protein